MSIFFLQNKFANLCRYVLDFFVKICYHINDYISILFLRGGIGMRTNMQISAEDIRHALENDQFVAYYQPQYNPINNTIVSAEALVRWLRTDGSIVPPMEFIPLAEESDLILDIDHYILEEVCRMLSRRIESGHKIFPISVNFSRRHLLQNDFRETLCGIVDSYKVPRKYITVELTESAIMENPINLIEMIAQIRKDGFDIAVDDFGSGLSSLSLIKDISANILKIDKSLLSGNCDNEKERILLESIFDFAHRLKLTTVAEGVETVEQLGFLRTCDCKMIQGYYYAKPMPLEDFEELCSKEPEIPEVIEDVLLTQSPASATQLLLDVIFTKYPLVIMVNVSRNSYYMMAYEHFTTQTCAGAGIFSELVEGGAATMHPDDRELFRSTYSLENLKKEYAKGTKCVSVTTRQLGDDGIYRRVLTCDYFVKNPTSDDILVITLCETLE